MQLPAISLRNIFQLCDSGVGDCIECLFRAVHMQGIVSHTHKNVHISMESIPNER